jgi:hypothetical protein
MKNYRTTLIGAALAGLSFLSIYQANGGNLAHWQQWAIPLAIAILGYVAKDAGVTGSLKILVGSLFLLTLPSCTTSNGTTLFAGLSKADWMLVTKDASSAALKSATQAGLISYTTRRLTSAKNPTNVLP